MTMASVSDGSAVPVIRTRGLGKVYSPGSEAEVVALRDVVVRRDFNRLSVPGRQPGPAAIAFEALLDAP